MKAAYPMDELVQAVSVAGHIPPDRAAVAVEAMLLFFGAKLPSPLFGELLERLHVSNRGATLPPGMLMRQI